MGGKGVMAIVRLGDAEGKRAEAGWPWERCGRLARGVSALGKVDRCHSTDSRVGVSASLSALILRET